MLPFSGGRSQDATTQAAVWTAVRSTRVRLNRGDIAESELPLPDYFRLGGLDLKRRTFEPKPAPGTAAGSNMPREDDGAGSRDGNLRRQG